jgi:hypothetical protein
MEVCMSDTNFLCILITLWGVSFAFNSCAIDRRFDSIDRKLNSIEQVVEKVEEKR